MVSPSSGRRRAVRSRTKPASREPRATALIGSAGPPVAGRLVVAGAGGTLPGSGDVVGVSGAASVGGATVAVVVVSSVACGSAGAGVVGGSVWAGMRSLVGVTGVLDEVVEDVAVGPGVVVGAVVVVVEEVVVVEVAVGGVVVGTGR